MTTHEMQALYISIGLLLVLPIQEYGKQHEAKYTWDEVVMIALFTIVLWPVALSTIFTRRY